jgi:hypothetical protein
MTHSEYLRIFCAIFVVGMASARKNWARFIFSVLFVVVSCLSLASEFTP